jgi:hypothetical protein
MEARVLLIYLLLRMDYELTEKTKNAKKLSFSIGIDNDMCAHITKMR